MKTVFIVLLVALVVGWIIFLALCHFFPDWFDAWAGDEPDQKEAP